MGGFSRGGAGGPQTQVGSHPIIAIFLAGLTGSNSKIPFKPSLMCLGGNPAKPLISLTQPHPNDEPFRDWMSIYPMSQMIL